MASNIKRNPCKTYKSSRPWLSCVWLQSHLHHYILIHFFACWKWCYLFGPGCLNNIWKRISGSSLQNQTSSHYWIIFPINKTSPQAVWWVVFWCITLLKCHVGSVRYKFWNSAPTTNSSLLAPNSLIQANMYMKTCNLRMPMYLCRHCIFTSLNLHWFVHDLPTRSGSYHV